MQLISRSPDTLHTAVKGNLQTSAVLMIVSVVFSFISLLLFLPLFHWVVIIVADVLTLFTGT